MTNPPHSSPTTTIVDTIYHDLREAIALGHYHPGEKLKAEHIKGDYQASGASVREALNRLLADSLVEVSNRRGFRVAPFTIEDLQDITTARLLIEVECVKSSVKHGDDSWEMNLVAAYHHLAKLEKRTDIDQADILQELDQRNRHFHDCLVAACPSPILLGFYNHLFTRHYRYRRVSLRHKKILKEAAREHKALLEAALARDINLAGKLISTHINRTSELADSLMDLFAEATQMNAQTPPAAPK